MDGLMRGRNRERRICHGIVVKEGKSVRHGDDTGKSALYLDSLV